MSAGGGKYEAECTAARESAKAVGAILIILGGRAGAGFEAQVPPGILPVVPAMLRDMADQMTEDLKAAGRI